MGTLVLSNIYNLSFKSMMIYRKKAVHCIKQRPWPPSSTTKQHPSAQATDYGATVCRLICHIYSAKQSQLRQPPHTTIVLLYPRISPDAPAVLLLYVLLLLLHWHFG